MNDTPNIQAGTLFDPAHYPRTYRASLGWLIALVALGAVVGIAGLAGVWYFGTGHEADTVGSRIALTALSLFFALLGTYLVLSTIRAKVVLLPDAVVSSGLFRSRTLRRGEIKGFRTKAANGISYMDIIPKSAGLRKLSITLLFKQDQQFVVWFADLPNLDVAEYIQSAQEIETNREIGHTPVERLQKADRARKAALTLNTLTGGLMVWAIFYPKPYTSLMAFIMLVPWIGIAIAKGSNGLFTIEDPGKNTAKADLTLMLIMPGIMLFLRVLFDIQLVDWTSVVLPAAAGGVVIAAMLLGMFTTMRKRKLTIALLVVFLGIYAGSSLVMTNALLDQSTPEAYKVKVMKKHTTSGKTTTHYFTVPAWGPRHEPDDITVSGSYYRTKKVGDDICIFLFPGRFGFPWFVVEECGK